MGSTNHWRELRRAFSHNCQTEDESECPYEMMKNQQVLNLLKKGRINRHKFHREEWKNVALHYCEDISLTKEGSIIVMGERKAES